MEVFNLTIEVLNMTKTSFVRVACFASLAVFSGAALSETLTLNGTVVSTCSFGSPTDGTLNVAGTNITTVTPASIEVTNNGAGAFNLILASGVLASAPAPLAITGDVVMTPGSVSGPNVAVAWSGTDAFGYTKALTDSGVDVVNLSVSATLDDVALPGAYTITNTITCS